MTVLLYKDGRILTDEGNPLENISLEGLLALINDPKEGQMLTFKGMFTNAEPKFGQSVTVGKTHIINGQDSEIINGVTVDVVGSPVYVNDVSEYSAYGIENTGWYVFATIPAPEGVTVGETTAVTGADGSIIETGANHIDIAVCFDVAAQSRTVTINWDGSTSETYIFRAVDLAIRNLDYRTTFYVYDIAPYTTWEYALTTDETFVADKAYYTLDNGVHTLAEVTTGEAVPADTYYNHSKVIFEGMPRNVTYSLDTPIDCPLEFKLPEIEDDGHGAWFEVQTRYTGSFSCTLTPPEGVKVGSTSTQSQTGGMNVIDLHYTNVNGYKMWTLLNTHTNLPTT